MLRRSLLALPAAVMLPGLMLPRHTLGQAPTSLEQAVDRAGRDRDGRMLGDDGFMHYWVHDHYQDYFPHQDCPCHDGECRPTTWRRDPKNLRIIQAWINRKWVSADDKTKIRDRTDVPADFPKELREYDAHACAYTQGGVTTLTCLWILNAMI
ncbi:MAG TPA: hypothetical protein VG984_01530 [Candidatus Paceibacterota bacterium]|nr:hypothetical protein [Candidatus Paceibacterota bacterium]